MGLAKSFGFSLVEVIVATGIASVVMLGSSTLMLSMNQSEKEQEKSFLLLSLRQEIQNRLVSINGWSSVVSANSELSCIQNPSTCTNVNSAIPLKLPLRNIVLDSSNNKLGMTSNGVICNSFDSTVGDDKCPYGISINWQTECDNAICKNPTPKVLVSFKMKTPSSTLKNLSSLNLVIYKDPKLESLNEVCQSMGGTLSGSTCNLNNIASSCDPANSLGFGSNFPLGFDSNGSLICGLPTPGTCASSDVAYGFANDGSILCTPACH